MGIRNAIVPVLIAATLLLAGCAAPQAGEGSPSSSSAGADEAAPKLAEPTAALQRLGLSADDPRGIVDALDALQLSERPTDLMVSVLPDRLRVQPDQPDELVLPLAAGDFYLSIAPYRDETHPCTFHSLTTCVGEMRSADVALRITDSATGEVLVEETTRTADNGFVGVWLPSDRTLEVEVTAGGESGGATVATGKGDPTCLTTIQLG